MSIKDNLKFYFKYLKFNPKLIFLIILTILFVLILAYKLALFFTPLTDAQEITIDHLQKGTAMDDKVLPYTEDERSHLKDVKKIMHRVDQIFFLLCLSLLIAVSYFRIKKNKFTEERKKFVFRTAKFSGISTIAAVLLSVILGLLSFKYLFALFHQIFFPQGNWIFAADSLLIQTFPGSFFVWMSVKIAVISLLIAVIMAYPQKIFIPLQLYLKNVISRKRP